jgi:uncharacterized protein YqhQ
MARKAGGQAVLNGVMMRGDDRYAVAVRTPAGDIEVLSGDLVVLAPGLKKVPLLRGILALAEALPLGFKAMRWSSRTDKGAGARLLAALAAVTVLPLVAGDLWGNALALAALVVAVRPSRLRRLFQYHGAEHKVVAAFEAGVELTPERAAPFSTRHVRCGTSLLLLVVAVSAVLSIVISSGLALVPAVAAVSTELHLRLAANTDRRWVRALLRPGLALQRVTTREPSADQLEVAIVALRAAYGETISATQPSSSRTVAVPA